MLTIFSTKYVKNILPGQTGRFCEDGTITQPLPSRCGLCTSPVCLKIGLKKNPERNQRVGMKTMRLLTSFSTVCVKNPVRGKLDWTGLPAQKTGARIFSLQINRLGAGLYACAQFCPQKMCRRRRPRGRCSRAQSCLFFGLGNFHE